MDKDNKGIHEMINDSIQKSPESIRGELYSNIILSGDTKFPGIEDRLKKEISNIIFYLLFKIKNNIEIKMIN